MSKFQSIEQVKKKYKKNYNDWRKPIILEWLSLPGMEQVLEIIDKKVEYLINKKAWKKLKQWFSSDDRDFNSITAERYIIDYLKLKNKNIEDNLFNKGVDAVYNFNDQKIGMEITTINGFIADWIFTDGRLLMYLEEKQSLDGYTLEIDYNYERIKNEMGKNNIYGYIQNVGESIISNNANELKSLEIECTKTNRLTGCISWHHNRADDFPFIKYITEGLIERLNKKTRQLSQYGKNLIFVGVNHAGPDNLVNPAIFKEIGQGGISYQQEIQMIQNFLSEKLPQNIIGVCYYNYHLKRMVPFYQLKIFWRNQDEIIPINL